MSSYLLLFAASFVAATILPFYSEVVLFALLDSTRPAWLLVATATLGNTLGAVVNWLLGRYLLRFSQHRWFYFKPAEIEKMQQWFNRYGKWSLLLAWLPVGGDALTFIAGVMRVPLGIFLLLVGFGKSVRYIAVVYLAGLIELIRNGV